MKDIDAESREQAERLVGYFEFIASENEGEIWQKGLNTAQEWLRLINAKNPLQTEILAFIGIVHANRSRTSGWYALALGGYHWAKAKGVPIAAYEIFLGPEGLPDKGQFYEQTSQEQAHTLLLAFEEYDKEDPDSKGWAAGIEVMQEWLRIIQTPKAKKSEISALVKSVFDSQDESKVWFSTCSAICYWCKENGYLDLVPGKYRSLFSNGNETDV